MRWRRRACALHLDAGASLTPLAHAFSTSISRMERGRTAAVSPHPDGTRGGVVRQAARTCCAIPPVDSAVGERDGERERVSWATNLLSRASWATIPAMTMRWLVLVVAMLVPFAMVSTVSETAQAQVPSKKQRQEQAKKAFKAGKAKMQAGNYAGALTDFQLADASWPGAAPKYNIAFCYDKLGKNKEALLSYERFLASNPSEKYADRMALAKRRIAELKAAEKKRSGGKLLLKVNPPINGISIMVDGQPIAGTELEVPPGPHTVEATAPGYAPFRQQVDVVGGTQLEVPITMLKAVAPPPKRSNKGKPLIIAGFVVGGVGVVSGVMVTAFGVMALNAASDFDATPTTELADDTDRNGLIADVFLPFAIAGVGAGAVLLGVGYSQQNTGAVRLSPMFTAGGGGAQLSVDF